VAPGAKQFAGGEADIEVMPEADSKQLCLASQQLEEEANKLRTKAKGCISGIRNECNRANARVEERLNKRAESTSLVTKKLISQGKEIDFAIIQAHRTLEQNRKIMNSKDRKTAANYKAAEDLLNDLRRTRQELKHDLQQKNVLLTTSEACRKVTPQVAASPAAKRLQRPATAGSVVRGPRGSSMSQKSNNSMSLPTLPAASPPSNAPRGDTSSLEADTTQGYATPAKKAAAMPKADVTQLLDQSASTEAPPSVAKPAPDMPSDKGAVESNA